jgi:hypothetical protein
LHNLQAAGSAHGSGGAFLELAAHLGAGLVEPAAKRGKAFTGLDHVAGLARMFDGLAGFRDLGRPC